MHTAAPHYLLLTQTDDRPEAHPGSGRWTFVLERVGSDWRRDESDVEPRVWGERLQLLAVVRGLEALEEPARVTLVTPSRYVGSGIRGELRQWKRDGWLILSGQRPHPLPHRELWQRLDQAMQIHQLTCRVWQFEKAHGGDRPDAAGPPASAPPDRDPASVRGNAPHRQRIRIDNDLRQRFFNASRELMRPASQYLADRIKPIGQGRAYGYAVN